MKLIRYAYLIGMFRLKRNNIKETVKVKVMGLKHVFEKNKKWVKDKLAVNKNCFKDLEKAQNPDVLYIGCSDSRVDPEEIMGVEMGEVFVHRNIANMVPVSDLSVMSVIEYGVKYLKVNHIVLCGHYGCGGVKASLQSDDFGVLNPWLKNIKDVYHLNEEELNAIKDEEKRYDRLVELNVKEQCINLLKNLAIQKAIRSRGLTVHGWVYDIHTGKLIDLKIDLEGIFSELMKTYRLD